MITLKRFRRIEAVMRAADYGHMIEWSEAIPKPADADAFAEQAVYVICNSGMMNRVAEPIFNRCMVALRKGLSSTTVYGHPGKAAAIDRIWVEREQLFAAYLIEADTISFLRSLPWIGEVTSFHLAKNLGADVAKPDVHMERLARRDQTDTHKLCARLSRQTGYRIATIDTVLWRACADGLLDSTTYERRGWKAAFKPKRFLSHI